MRCRLAATLGAGRLGQDVDLHVQLRRDEVELAGDVLADLLLGSATAGAGLLALGEIVIEAEVPEMIEAGSPRGPGGLGWPGGRIVGRGRRRRFGFGEDLGDVEEMTLARSVAEPLAALAEEVATQQGQGLGQFVVSLLQLLVIGRGPVEDAFEFVDAALRVFSLLRGGLGSLPQSILLEQAFEFVDAALSRLGSLPGLLGLLMQLRGAAEQVVEHLLEFARIVREARCDTHDTNYILFFMSCKSSSDDFRLLRGPDRGVGTAGVVVPPSGRCRRGSWPVVPGPVRYHRDHRRRGSGSRRVRAACTRWLNRHDQNRGP